MFRAFGPTPDALVSAPLMAGVKRIGEYVIYFRVFLYGCISFAVLSFPIFYDTAEKLNSLKALSLMGALGGATGLLSFCAALALVKLHRELWWKD